MVPGAMSTHVILIRAIEASRFAPVLVERLLALRSTARNWNTVRKIAAALG